MSLSIISQVRFEDSTTVKVGSRVNTPIEDGGDGWGTVIWIETRPEGSIGTIKYDDGTYGEWDLSWFMTNKDCLES